LSIRIHAAFWELFKIKAHPAVLLKGCVLHHAKISEHPARGGAFKSPTNPKSCRRETRAGQLRGPGALHQPGFKRRTGSPGLITANSRTSYEVRIISHFRPGNLPCGKQQQACDYTEELFPTIAAFSARRYNT